jgi:flagellar export protein FliJ
MAEKGFRLGRVLRLRTRLREQADDAVARATAVVAALDARIASARRTEDETRAAVAAALEGGLPGAELARWRAFAEAAAARTAALVAERAVAEEGLAAARRLLAQRRREERQLERLGERVATRAAIGRARAAQTALDDLARTRRGR